MSKVTQWRNRVMTWWYRSFLLDHCEVCGGHMGGIRGNENIVDGKVMCDFCSMIASVSEKALKLSFQVNAANHVPGCKYWSWDWSCSWDATDCTCESELQGHVRRLMKDLEAAKQSS